MRQEATKALYNHWLGLCRGGIVPDRSDLDPAQIGHVLRDVFILGADASGQWRYRVAGTRLSGLAGRELFDEIFENWWQKEDRQDATRLLSAVANDGLPVIAGMRGIGQDNCSFELEGLLLPLRHGGRSRLRMLGGIFPSSAAANKPGLKIDNMVLLSVRTLDPNKPPQATFGVSPVNLETIVARRHNLRVIEGGLNQSR